MARKYFGTDGIRGPVGQYPITPDFMLKLGWAAGKVLARKGRGKVLIGKDTRISGYMFEAALEAGLAAAGVDINILCPMPTPAEARPASSADRKSTRLNSSHVKISYSVFCLIIYKH